MVDFWIDGVKLSAEEKWDAKQPLPIASVPRNYVTEWIEGPPSKGLAPYIAASSHPIVLADRLVFERYFSDFDFGNTPIMLLDATEQMKNVYSALDVCKFLQEQSATRGSMFFVIGGGIIQDVGAYAACTYKRGIPWTYVPTTMLAQADSCIGGKTGLNHDGIKNLIALFSAPARVLLCRDFLGTLSREDILSGMGEVLRLHVTGGPTFVKRYEEFAPAFLAGDLKAGAELISSSLSVKKAVVEKDEFELNLRKSLNYGHSMGHAFEAITNHGFPHGVAVAVGMMVENEIAKDMAGFTEEEAAHVARLASQLVSPATVKILQNMNLSSIADVLMKDKKSVGRMLKLACESKIGTMVFLDFPLGPNTEAVTRDAVTRALARL